MDFPGRNPAVRFAILTLLSACLSSCGAPSFLSGGIFYPAPGAFSLEHGAAIIEEGEFSAEAADVPWSGYWYPLSRMDARSALEKYDRLSGRHAVQVEVERIRGEGRPYQPWEGRCDAWAFASILEPEPSRPIEVVVDGRRERFSVAEQKALWIFAHELLDPGARRVVGERNDGDGASRFEDLEPAEFHRVLQVMLQERRQAFIMDRDPRPPVWNTPVHGARWTIRRDPSRADLFHVQAWIHAVFPYDEDLDSTERVAPVIEYTYDLEAHPNPAGSGFEVHASRWVGGSLREHPDFVTILDRDASASPRSRNLELDLEWIRAHLRPPPDSSTTGRP